MMKKIFNLLITLMILLNCMVIPANASDNVTVKLNGEKIYFDQPPIIQNGRTLVPMRAIFEAMGCEVIWDDGMIDVWKDDENIMTLWIDDTQMWLPDGNITLDVPPQIVNDRTLVPVRAISESMGADVEWDDISRTVLITYYENTMSGCAHEYTHEVCMIDFRRFENTGSATLHNVIDIIDVTCDDCGETVVQSKKKVYERNHVFENDVCTACGYSKNGGLSSDNACTHESTREYALADSIEYINIGSSDIHNKVTAIVTQCNECGMEVDERTNTEQRAHDFYGNTYELCGYTKKSDSTQSVVSSSEITESSDGTFMYISIPKGMAIKVPNTSNGKLEIGLDGIYNIMERESDNKITVKKYKTDLNAYKMSKDSETVIESMENGLIVKIPLEYARYQKTSEKVYNIVRLNAGESIKLTPNNDQKIYIYFSSRNFEYIEYDDKGMHMSGVQNADTDRDLAKSRELIVTANEDLEVYYCPATTDYTNSDAAFLNISVAAGEKIRIHSNDSSQVRLYTDGNHEYVYAIYGIDGTVKDTSSKPRKNETRTINKNCYIDLTNVSGETMIIKVTNIYSRVDK